jgi:protease-4
MQGLIDELAGKFLNLVALRRHRGPEEMAGIAAARIYLAPEALQLKLVDDVGYLKDAVSEAKALAGLPKDAKVIVYRRAKYANDNLYNTSAAASGGAVPPLIEMNLPEIIPPLTPGFYYLWLPGAAGN